MSEVKQLKASARMSGGKGAARAVRLSGKVPAVIYGGSAPVTPIALDAAQAHRLIYAGHFLTTVFEIDVDGKSERVIPRDYQLDVVRDTPLHVDFLRLKPGSTLRINVPVHVVGAEVSPGVKIGGTLNVVLHTIELRVPADNIPEAITADVSAMGVNESLHISAIKLPEGCKPIIQDRDFTVVTIAPPAKVEEAPAPAAAPAKGKK